MEKSIAAQSVLVCVIVGVLILWAISYLVISNNIKPLEYIARQRRARQKGAKTAGGAMIANGIAHIDVSALVNKTFDSIADELGDYAHDIYNAHSVKVFLDKAAHICACSDTDVPVMVLSYGIEYEQNDGAVRRVVLFSGNDACVLSAASSARRKNVLEACKHICSHLIGSANLADVAAICYIDNRLINHAGTPGEEQ